MKNYLDAKKESSYARGMNKLPVAKRAQILTLLCEGVSMRSIERIVGCSINTVDKLLCEAGEAALAYHDKAVRGVKSQRIQCDEIWSFVHAKQKNAPTSSRRGDPTIGDCWTWTALDADSKLLVSYQVGGRDAEYALMLMDDFRGRLANRVQLTDGHKAYLQAVRETFGADIDYGMLVKLYGPEPSGKAMSASTTPQSASALAKVHPKHVSTSYTERANLTMRMSMRRFSRLTNAFSKKLQNHGHMVALYALWYNFVRIHKTLRTSPAMTAGIESRLWSMEDVVAMMDARSA